MPAKDKPTVSSSCEIHKKSTVESPKLGSSVACRKQNPPLDASKLESGELKLVQISKLQKVCRLIKKETGKAVSLEKQKEILTAVKNEGAKKTDLILAQELNFTVLAKTLEKTQKDESVRVELTFSKAEMELIKKAQGLLSHKTGGGLKLSILEMAAQVVTVDRLLA